MPSRQNFCRTLILILTATLTMPETGAASPLDSLSDWFDANMIDEEDGKLDASDYLSSTTGFFPVPIIVTEPALGFGGGLAVAYFHPPKDIDRELHSHRGPPSISVGFAAKTDNGSSFAGGAHSGVWRDDHIRYLGAVAAADINLKIFASRGQDTPPDDGIGFNVDGEFVFQQMQFRLRESNWWLGGSFLYIDAAVSFKLDEAPPDGLPEPSANFTQAGLGAFVEYDGRNSTFTATQGIKALLEFRNYDSRWGSDFDYDHVVGSLQHFTPIGDYSSFGVRVDAETVSDGAPFFGYPYVNLRGIPALRYQGQDVFTAELEYLWGLTPRWTLALFAGAGKTNSVDALGYQGDDVAAGGLGVRYRLARKLGMQLGVDVARGPEESAIYLTVGSAW